MTSYIKKGRVGSRNIWLVFELKEDRLTFAGFGSYKDAKRTLKMCRRITEWRQTNALWSDYSVSRFSSSRYALGWR